MGITCIYSSQGERELDKKKAISNGFDWEYCVVILYFHAYFEN